MSDETPRRDDDLPPPLERPALDDVQPEEEQVPTSDAPPLESPALDASAAAEPEPEAVPPPPRESLLVRVTRELPPEPFAVPASTLRRQTRRDFLLFGAGVAATAVGAWWLLPDGTKMRIAGSHLDSLAFRTSRETFLNRVLTFDDDVAEALYSPDRAVPTYSRRDVTPLRNNYHSPTPTADYLKTWTLTLDGLASGTSAVLRIDELLQRFAHREQVTRLVCVEGWSAIAWWGGLRFRDLLAAYPPHPRAKWAAMAAAPDRYYVSIDLDTARHPQTLLATHHNGAPLTVAHGAPMRLVVPMKLGLKNIKAVTHIEYTEHEPPDFWAQQGYSKYDGI